MFVVEIQGPEFGFPAPISNLGKVFVTWGGGGGVAGEMGMMFRSYRVSGKPCLKVIIRLRAIENSMTLCPPDTLCEPHSDMKER